jgi:phosphoribosylanthranilate isomerase
MPSGPGVIPDELIAEIVRAVPSDTNSFLLTSETDAEAVIAHHRKVNTSTIQLVDALPAGSHEQIKNALPHVKLVQVLHVLDEAAIDEAHTVAPWVDALLLDSGNPNLLTKELGGTGRIHDWSISKRIVDSVALPVFLAGGLNPDNARQAIEQVNPFGLDMCSGLRTNGKLDPVKVSLLFESLNTK